MFSLGLEAGRRSGCVPAVYNAANEVAVRAFLEGRIGFPDIFDVVLGTMDSIGAHAPRDLEDVIAVDGEARTVAAQQVARCQTMMRATP